MAAGGGGDRDRRYLRGPRRLRQDLETCKARFDNVENFRGFPHMPGNDTALAVAKRDDVENDGGSLFN